MKINLLYLTLMVLSISGCNEPASTQKKQTFRPLKTVTLGPPPTHLQTRKFSGIIQAKEITALSFESGGKITEIFVEDGDKITSGQVLAVLDQEPFQLRLDSALADLSIKESDLQNAKNDLKRKKELRVKGFVSESDLDLATSKYQSALKLVDSAKSNVALSKRELENTIVKAPFDGRISKKLVNTYAEISSGTPAFEIDGEGQLQVELQIPENIISYLSVGMKSTILIANKTSNIKGVISRMGSAGREGNVFLIDVDLLNPPHWVFTGMSAEVTLSFYDGKTDIGYILPASAVLPDPESNSYFVFLYQKETSTVSKTKIEISGGSDHKAVITSGLHEGDIVAVAGASFLLDGMKVLYPESEVE